MNIHFGGTLKKNAKGGNDRTGQGSSFKDALTYYLHDKTPDGQDGPHAQTSERVGFIHMHNLPPVEPKKAWREMVTLWNQSPILQREAAEREGREYRHRAPAKNPVFVYSVDFHEAELDGMDDAERIAHMRETALDTLQALGLSEHQAMLIEHLPEMRKDGTWTKPHVHVCANLIHPETGMKAPLKFYETVMRNWAAEYEIKRGVIRSPKAHENYMAYLEKSRSFADKRRRAEILKMALVYKTTRADAITTPDLNKNMPRKEWEARRNRPSNTDAKAAVAEIKKAYWDRKRQLEARHKSAYERRRLEFNDAYKEHQRRRAEVFASFKPQLDNIWKRPDRSRMGRLRSAFRDPIGALRDHDERQQWRRMNRRHWQERRAFEAREKTITGAVTNAIRLLRVADPDIYRGRLSAVYHLSRDAEQRRQLFQQMHDMEKEVLRGRHAARRKAMAEPLNVARTAQLDALAARYDQQRAEIKARHAKEQAAEKADRAALNLGMQRAWNAWREKFNITENKDRQKPAPGERMADFKASAPDVTGKKAASARPARDVQKPGFNEAAKDAPAAATTPDKSTADIRDEFKETKADITNPPPLHDPQREAETSAFRNAADDITRPAGPEREDGEYTAFRRKGGRGGGGRQRPTPGGRKPPGSDGT